MTLNQPIPKRCSNCQSWDIQINGWGRCANPSSCVFGVVMHGTQDCTLFIAATTTTTPLKHKAKNKIKSVLEWRRSGKK